MNKSWGSSSTPDLLYGAFLVAQMVKNLLAMWETRVPLLGQESPLEEEMATHSSILAWRISRTGELVRLQSMASQSIGHNWATKHNLETWQVVPYIATISAIMTASFLSLLYQHWGGWVILAECFVSWLLCICSMVNTLLWVLVIM